MPSSAELKANSYAPPEGPPTYATNPPSGEPPQEAYQAPQQQQAYTPPQAPPQQGFAPQQPQGYPPQGYPQQQGYAPQNYPPQGYAPQQQYTPQAQLTPQQLGEQYRANLFAACAQGHHSPSTKFGVFGIIMAVVCFPCGLICLFSDTEQRCDRCGVKLS
ncbi:hypothetical protein HMN09_00085700 [Mycena chlorophos]|uniref:Uncharacterized protein n=2 Tax=Mycena chlorophos TaxID=658473 RepID=A0ABQ0LQ64_MYCCL|nr:hypothetical protein HMN09_00085700 [Mycena chlorophos]GAT53249.1 predicted protein [Mycena chlorophos]